MKKIKCEISKIFYFPLFAASCAGIVLVCLLSECYIDTSSFRGYTVIEMMIGGMDVNMLDHIELNSIEVWKAGLGTWVSLLLPLLLGAGYLSVLSVERQSGAIRQVLIRENNFSYCLSKLVSASVYAGVLLTTGYLLYGVVVFASFPPLSVYQGDMAAMYMEMNMSDGILWFVIKRIAGIFLYGVFLSFYAVGVSIFAVDRYILLCLPMMLNYIYSQALTKIEYDAFSRNDFAFADRLRYLRPENIIRTGANLAWSATLLWMLFLFLVLLGLFCFVLGKRGDSGGWT